MTTEQFFPRRLDSLAASLLTALSLVACGGGDAATGSSATPDSASNATTSQAQVVNDPSQPSDPQSSALGQTTGGPLLAEAAGATSAGAERTSGTAAPGTTYYIDSKQGNDNNDGKSAVAIQGTTHGAWKTLARLASTPLNPGDGVRLICGSMWQETLNVASSGTALQPISIAGYPSGCTNPPTIDGSVSIPPAAWTRSRGSIFKATLAKQPLLITSPTGVLVVAHHPNRGFDTTQTSSMYLRNAHDSDAVVSSGHPASTYVTMGADVVLPPGTSLTAGTAVRLRPNAWTIDDSTIASVSGTRINLSTPTSYPMLAGWGYFLMGQLWMLDSPGEWYWDKATTTLSVWMPDSAPPQATVSAATLAAGINLDSHQYVSVENIAIRMVGTGISMRHGAGISVRGVRIDDVADVGIDGSNGTGNQIQASTVNRTGTEGISGVSSTGMQALNNTITSAGVTLSGETVTSLPRESRGAILGGQGSTITGNTITNSGYNGITVWLQSSVAANVVYGACSVLDDGAGIYTSTAGNNSTVTGNVVQHSRGAVEGKPISAAFTQAQGIYVDDHSSGVSVLNNTVTDTDNGIQVHIASNNVIQGNRLYGNRKSQLWLQETSNVVQPTGDVFGNSILENQIAPTTSTARGLYLQSQIQDTYHFGQFDRNVYLDRIYARVSTEEAPASVIDYSFPAWKSAKLPNGTPRLLDANGKAASSVSYAPALVSGTNVVPNGNLSSNAVGWAGWNQASPIGVLARQACAPGFCANYVAGGSQGILSTPNFSIIKNQWYRVSLDVLAGADGQTINALVRRGGGGTNGYEALSNVYFSGTASKTWKRISFTLQANATVNAADPLTQDKGARLDIEHIQPGQVLWVTNVEIVPITAADSATSTALLLNATGSSTQAACPLAGTAPEQCMLYVRLSDNAPIAWPYGLAARSSEIVYTLDPTLIDSDGDGIADSQDRCPGTPTGAAVNSIGCSMGQ